MDASNVIDRVMNLKEFTVTTKRPEELYFDGIVPFDLAIQGDVITAVILAESLKEATERLHQFLYGKSN
jgi:hypothetical protein